MKPAKKPFVVEIKNPRRLSRGKNSIWDKVDLKAAGDQVTGELMAEESAEAVANKNAGDISA
ncbi:hypothetical protein [Rhizobium metallidurans]|uniref:tRNA U54 and U55 pseudouridine synthase Pus10 n=1 Tax=Rhizobium metallidurans TaxID=1265931 RepID=A0A7W6GC91_9HYPH|nr:hypothetical protein [Rhizobium metallidurans]MBB3965815.1 tRNA U54 and U55 pseudouridine synthase Pus10 [Rhizobium metallidurans]